MQEEEACCQVMYSSSTKWKALDSRPQVTLCSLQALASNTNGITCEQSERTVLCFAEIERYCSEVSERLSREEVGWKAGLWLSSWKPPSSGLTCPRPPCPTIHYALEMCKKCKLLVAKRLLLKLSSWKPPLAYLTSSLPCGW